MKGITGPPSYKINALLGVVPPPSLDGQRERHRPKTIKLKAKCANQLTRLRICLGCFAGKRKLFLFD